MKRYHRSLPEVVLAANSYVFPRDRAENRGEGPSDTALPLWLCKYTQPVHAHQLTSIFWQKWKHCLVFCTHFESAMHFLGPNCSADIVRNTDVARTGAGPEASPLLPCHRHTWWHLMISHLNSDALEKNRLCSLGDGVGRKASAGTVCSADPSPRCSIGCPERAQPQNKLEQQMITGGCRGSLTASVIKPWSNVCLGAVCVSHGRCPVG